MKGREVGALPEIIVIQKQKVSINFFKNNVWGRKKKRRKKLVERKDEEMPLGVPKPKLSLVSEDLGLPTYWWSEYEQILSLREISLSLQF